MITFEDAADLDKLAELVLDKIEKKIQICWPQVCLPTCTDIKACMKGDMDSLTNGIADINEQLTIINNHLVIIDEDIEDLEVPVPATITTFPNGETKLYHLVTAGEADTNIVSIPMAAGFYVYADRGGQALRPPGHTSIPFGLDAPDPLRQYNILPGGGIQLTTPGDVFFQDEVIEVSLY